MTRQVAKVEVSDILPLAITLVVAGIGIAFGLNIIGDTKSDFCPTGYPYNATADTCQDATNVSLISNTAAFNATNDTITGVSKFSGKMGLIATVIVAAIVIGLLVRYLFVR